MLLKYEELIIKNLDSQGDATHSECYNSNWFSSMISCAQVTLFA